MNEHVALAWGGEIQLARELPFVLAGTHVRPAALEIETGGQAVSLEPRVMKVLVALHRSRGEPVSRDDLIDLCWGGRIVSEGALNRCVAQLRKALAGDPRIGVETIPTVGYRLKAAPAEAGGREAARPEPATEPQTRPAPSRRRLVGAAAGAILVAGAAAALLWPRPADWRVADYRPLTAERGLETHPALSPGGDFLAYAVRPDAATPRDLWLRGVGQGTPVRLTTDPADDYGAAWSPRGDRIAFVRQSGVEPCRIMTVPVPLGPERLIGRCAKATYTKVAWLDERTVVLSDRPTADALPRVRAMDVETGAVRDLTAPPPGAMGDAEPQPSPDGRRIVFRRTRLHGADDLYLKDLKTGRERALTTDGWKAAGYVWSADGRHVFYSSNRGGDFGLWTVDTRSGGPPRRVALALGAVNFSRMSADRANHLAVEAPRGRTNLAVLDPGGAVRTVTDAAGGDWDAEAAADGTLAFGSTRGGAPELWVQPRDGQAVRLTSLRGSFLHTPAWSPDGRSLAFVSVRGPRAEIYTVGRDGSELRRVTDDPTDKLDPAFASDGRGLLYLERGAAGWRLMRVRPGGRPEAVPGGEGWRSLRPGPDGRLYGLRRGEDVVRVLEPGGRASTPLSPAVRVGEAESWAVGPAGIYVLRGRQDFRPAVWLRPWNGAERRLADAPGAAGSLAVVGDGVLFARNLDDEVDLALIELTR